MPPSRVSVQSQISQLADRFSMPVPDTTAFLAADRHNPVTIKTGYAESTLAQLVGEIDEWELSWDAKGLRGSVSGRDYGARLLSRWFKKTYFRAMPTDPPPGGYAWGTFTAHGIAGDACASCGLSLIWDAPDYVIQDTVFAVSGTVGDTLRRVTALFGQPEMFAVDVYLNGTTVIVKQRKRAYETADYLLTPADLMATQITWKKHPGQHYGTVTIHGGDARGGGYAEVEGLPQEIEITETRETKAKGAKGILRVTSTKTILQSPANEVLLKERSLTEAGASATSGLLRVAETLKTISYDDVHLYDGEGRIAIPVKIAEVAEVWSVGGSDADWVLKRRETTTYDYTSKLELILQDTMIEELQNSTTTQDSMGFSRTTGGNLVPSERRLLINERLDANQYQTVTQIWAIETAKSGATQAQQPGAGMELIDSDKKVTRGQLPGPQRIRRPRSAAASNQSNTVFRQVVISSDPEAINVEISDNNLDGDGADLLIAQFTEASGKWQHEITIKHLALPFLKAGTVLGWAEALPGLSAPLPNMLITGLTMDFDASSNEPSYTANLTLSWWGDKDGN